MSSRALLVGLQSFALAVTVSAAGLSALFVSACGSEAAESNAADASPFGDGIRGGAFGDAGFTDSGPRVGVDGDGGCGPNLTGTLRDFMDTHPDFEHTNVSDEGIVLPRLGADFKPVYASATTTPSTSGKANFDQWYRDVPGVNMSFPYTLVLVEQPNGISTFQSDEFFPLDGRGFGNQGRNHNFHFTFELHTEFKYKGGEVFTFVGDDDVFAFINNELAIDLGGEHGAKTASVDLDAEAAKLGIERGKSYGLSVFQAERHTNASHFRIDTSIEFTNCNPIIH
jgi:fibro-slime domain-containing protein